MNAGRNRLVVTIGSLAAIGVLLGSFMVVWLMPHNPVTGNASQETPTGTSEKAAYAPAGAPISDQPHINVHGTGTISAKPDMANIQLGVQIQNTSLDTAQSEAATKMDAVMQQLKSAGIDEKDISTSQYNVEPVMNYRDNQPPEVTGFRVTNIVNVKVRDITKAGKLIDDLVKSGANTVYGLSFGFSNPDALMRQAREQAVADARAKAEQYATLTGVGLGAPLTVEDGGSNIPPVPVPMAADAGMAKSAAGTVINPGQQEIRADVSIMYGIK